MIRILVDSSSDILANDYPEKVCSVIPLKVNFDGEEYFDGVNLDRNEFYEKLTGSQVFPKTSQPSPQAFLEMFEEAKEAGDEVIAVLLSSKISGTYQNALLAKSMADYEKIYVVDSLSASYGIQFLVNEAFKLIDEGMEAAQIVERIEELKKRIQIYISVETLEYLYRGGRLSKASAAIGELAKVKPIITLKEGEVKVIGKTLGKLKVMSMMAKMALQDGIDENYPMVMGYTSGMENCDKLAEKSLSLGIKEDKRIQIGPTIGSHVGPGTFGLIFIKQN